MDLDHRGIDSHRPQFNEMSSESESNADDENENDIEEKSENYAG
jgi:hypothetical protein